MERAKCITRIEEKRRQHKKVRAKKKKKMEIREEKNTIKRC